MSSNDNGTSGSAGASSVPAAQAQGAAAPAPSAANPPCPTAPSLTWEKYNEIRVIAERMISLLPPGSYYTITEDPNAVGDRGKYKIDFMARGPGCPPDCQHCRDEVAANGIPPLSTDNNNNNGSQGPGASN